MPGIKWKLGLDGHPLNTQSEINGKVWTNDYLIIRFKKNLAPYLISISEFLIIEVIKKASKSHFQ